MTTITIPRSVTAAERELVALGQLATATEWHRAAIVAAYVNAGEGQGRRTSVRSDGSLESASTFAARGIHGLTSTTTILAYARAWLERFDRPVPGRKVTLPTDPWPPTRTGTDGYETDEGAARTIERIIDKHGPRPAIEALGRRPQPERAEALESLAGKVRESMDMPFDTPPAVPGGDRPIRSGYAVTNAIAEVERALWSFTQATRRYELGEDPVADGAMAKLLTQLEQSEQLVRAKLGLDSLEIV